MEQQVEQKFSLKKEVSAINVALKILIIAALALTITGIFTGCKKNSDKKTDIQDQYCRNFHIWC